jgi:predicted alpha/beta-hydrolase family hydrolase
MELKYKNEVTIPVNGISVKGELTIPVEAHSVVIFAHGSGSSRFSPRNQMVAAYLWEHNLGTLLFDLLTKEEDRDYETRFRIEFLSQRLVAATQWLQLQQETKGLYYSYFGASTGAAAALMAASAMPHITAVVSRGGRPDLAMEVLPNVKAPTLLIVGSLDEQVLQLNYKALDRLTAEKKLVQVQGATHLFEEPGTMEQVCALAASWFEKHRQPVV